MEQKSFQERSQAFAKALENLMKEHEISLSVSLTPANWLSRLLRKHLKVRWDMVLVDKSKK